MLTLVVVGCVVVVGVVLVGAVVVVVGLVVVVDDPYSWPPISGALPRLALKWSSTTRLSGIATLIAGELPSTLK
jgi:hypothetical protein